MQVDASTDLKSFKQFGVNSYPAVVGLLGNGEDYVLAPKKVFTQSGNKIVEELKKFLEELETKSKAAGVGNSAAHTEGDIPMLTKANAAVACGSTSPLCVIAAVDVKKGGDKGKKILSEVN
jgi:hypothetical protein